MGKVISMIGKVIGRRLLRLFRHRIVVMLTALFCIIVVATLWNMSRLSSELVQAQALQNAALSVQSMQQARTLYSSEVVNRLATHSDIQATHDYLSYKDAIPLPATFMLELSRQIRDNNPDMSVRLYSDYPFPWRQKEGGARDEFEVKALQRLRQTPHQPFSRVETYQGRQVLRYAEADIMQPSCVACHNTHPSSPKKDWAVGDVRGALEIIQPLDTFKPQSRQGLKSTFLMLGSLSLVGIVGLSVAIRSLQQRSQEVAIAKEKLEAVINAVPGSISWINANGIYMGVNRHFANTWQLAQEDFIGRMVGFLNGSGPFADFTQWFLESSHPSASQIIELHTQNQLRYYLIAVQKYQQGQAAVSVGIDVTEHKRAQEALRIAEENYRSIFENALEGIFQSSPQGQFIKANPALAQIYGYDSPAEMMETITNIGEQLYVDPEKRIEFKKLLEDQRSVKNFEYRCYCKDGSIIWTQIDARAVRDDQGNLLYYEGMVQDITSRKRNEDDLRRQLEELKIEIDQKKRETEVALLTESSYFQEVQQVVEDINLDEFWS